MKVLLLVLLLVVAALGLLVVAGAGLSDPGSSLLEVVGIALIPDWDLILSLLPLLLILGVIGPILSLVALGWTVHLLRRRRGRTRLVDPEPVLYQVDADGLALVPPNRPYCPRDRLLYPGNETVCDVCREELIVRCPVDETTRTARQQLCRACGTKYVLAASSTAVAVQRRGGPPEGGAAVA